MYRYTIEKVKSNDIYFNGQTLYKIYNITLARYELGAYKTKERAEKALEQKIDRQ